MLRRYQENLMPEPFELASPMMRPAASFQTDLQRGQLFEEGDHLPTMQFLYQRRLLQNIDPMQLENTLGRIHANTDKLLHGRLPCLRSPNGPHSGTLMPSGAVHPTVAARPRGNESSPRVDTRGLGGRVKARPW